jgi:DNA excision repair protein ERCC-4
MTDDFTLPALRSLGKLADVRPTIIVDTREQAPLVFKRLPFVRGSLQSGDYSALGAEHLFAVERKSLADMVSSTCSSERERFERELHRLRGFRFARLLICGPRSDIENHTYRSNASPKSVLNTIAAFEARYNVPAVFCANPAEAAEKVESWAYWFAREIVEAANDLLRGYQTLDRTPSEAGSPGTAGKPVPDTSRGTSGKTDPVAQCKARMRESAKAYNEKIHGAAQ